MSSVPSKFWGKAKHDALEILMGAQDGRCAYCARYERYGKMTLDHVMPLHVGGADEFENLLAVCLPCNAEKSGDLPVLEFHEFIRRRVHEAIRTRDQAA